MNRNVSCSQWRGKGQEKASRKWHLSSFGTRMRRSQPANSGSAKNNKGIPGRGQPGMEPRVSHVRERGALYHWATPPAHCGSLLELRVFMTVMSLTKEPSEKERRPCGTHGQLGIPIQLDKEEHGGCMALGVSPTLFLHGGILSTDLVNCPCYLIPCHPEPWLLTVTIVQYSMLIFPSGL
jgi:hypothetical protein